MEWANGISLSALARDAAGLDEDGFVARYGSAFLVVLHVCVQRGPRVPQQTQRHLEAVRTDTEPFGIDTEMVAFPVRKSAQSQLAFVGIGRLSGNDIVIVNDTISKFHAYIKADSDGRFALVQDGRSSNGTFVDGEAVARRGEGPPTRLRSGASVRFGSVSTVYLDATALLRLTHASVRAPLQTARAS